MYAFALAAFSLVLLLAAEFYCPLAPLALAAVPVGAPAKAGDGEALEGEP